MSKTYWISISGIDESIGVIQTQREDHQKAITELLSKDQGDKIADISCYEIDEPELPKLDYLYTKDELMKLGYETE